MLNVCITYFTENKKYRSFMLIKHKDLKAVKEEAVKINKQGFKVLLEVYNKGILIYDMELNHI